MQDVTTIKVININGETKEKTVNGAIYRHHWFIHKDEHKNYALTHINTGQRLNSFDSIETAKLFADVVIDDVGVDGSFQDKEEVPKYQRMVIRQLVQNLELLKLQEFAIISSINHTH